jgi:hypothetical protein
MAQLIADLSTSLEQCLHIADYTMCSFGYLFISVLRWSVVVVFSRLAFARHARLASVSCFSRSRKNGYGGFSDERP